MDNSDILEQAFLDDAKVAESENQSNQPQQDANVNPLPQLPQPPQNLRFFQRLCRCLRW